MSVRTCLLAGLLTVCLFSAQMTCAWDVGGPASFADVLQPAGASLAEYSSRGQDTIRAYFTEVSRRNCYVSPEDEIALFSKTTKQYQSGLACDKRKSDVFDFATGEWGTCDFTVFDWRFDFTTVIPEKVGKAGTFMAWCTLDGLLAEQEGCCGQQPEEADRTRLSIIGSVYYVNGPIVSSYPRGPARHSSCYALYLYPFVQNPTRAGNGTQPAGLDNSAQDAEPQHASNTKQRSPATAATTTPGSGLHRATFAKVLYGVATVATSARGVSVENGWFELVSEVGEAPRGQSQAAAAAAFPVPVTEAEAAGQYIYDPWRYKFTLKSGARR